MRTIDRTNIISWLRDFYRSALRLRLLENENRHFFDEEYTIGT